MCEICKSKNLDYKFINGPKKKRLYRNLLYRVYNAEELPIKLCYLHDLELFIKGEFNFLRRHLNYARNIAKRHHEDDYLDGLSSKTSLLGGKQLNL